MPRYVDSASASRIDYLGAWLEDNTEESLRAFRSQSGYFSFGSLRSFSAALKAIAAAKFPVRFVIGSNKGCTSKDDLRKTLALLHGGQRTSLTVVSFSNCEFHPKVVQVERADRSLAAYVGSANLTLSGLGINVEAGLVLDTREGDDPVVIQEIAASIDAWRTKTESFVLPVSSASDLDSLETRGLIGVAQPADSRTDRSGSSGRPSARSRKPGWMPTASSSRRTGRKSRTPQPATPVRANLRRRQAIAQWCKKMTRTDSMQNRGHSIANLRLTKARHSIDFLRYFRTDLFGDAQWHSGLDRNDNAIEDAFVEFSTKIAARLLGIQRLQIRHAPHRESHQRNHATVIYWGPDITPLLRKRSFVGHWVVIERFADDPPSLTIQRDTPTWAP